MALDMASRADLASEPKRASTLRGLWAALALTTFAADISALSRVLAENDTPRAEAAAHYDAARAHIAELEQQIAASDDPFGHPLMSIASYDAAIAGKGRERDLARRSGVRAWRILRLEAQVTSLTAERAAAVQADGWREEHDRLLRQPMAHAARPSVGAVEFLPVATILTGALQDGQRALGQSPQIQVSPEDIRGGMAWVATFAMKLMLTLGIWVGLQRSPLNAPFAPVDAAAGRAPTAPATRMQPRGRQAVFQRHMRFGR